MQPCNGYTRLVIYKNGELLRKTGDFVGLERFLINSVAGDQLRIQVLNDDKQPVSYWIWAGANYKMSPFVDMPIDRTVHVVKRYCNKAVLQFSRASNDENVRYCIHEKAKTFLEFVFNSQHFRKPRPTISATLSTNQPNCAGQVYLLADKQSVSIKMRQKPPFKMTHQTANLCNLQSQV